MPTKSQIFHFTQTLSFIVIPPIFIEFSSNKTIPSRYNQKLHFLNFWASTLAKPHHPTPTHLIPGLHAQKFYPPGHIPIFTIFLKLNAITPTPFTNLLYTPYASFLYPLPFSLYLARTHPPLHLCPHISITTTHFYNLTIYSYSPLNAL